MGPWLSISIQLGEKGLQLALAAGQIFLRSHHRINLLHLPPQQFTKPESQYLPNLPFSSRGKMFTGPAKGRLFFLLPNLILPFRNAGFSHFSIFRSSPLDPTFLAAFHTPFQPRCILLRDSPTDNCPFYPSDSLIYLQLRIVAFAIGQKALVYIKPF